MSEFLSSIKAGDYIKTQYRSEKPRVRKVGKVTRTQIVVSEWYWGDKPDIDRFRISDGLRINGYERWYDRTQIIPDLVSQEEIAAYEANIAESARFRAERKRLNEIEVWAKDKLFSLFGERIPADNIKVQFSSSDGLKTGFFEIKCEKVSEEVLVSTLEAVAAKERVGA
ncbi:MAG TPA: hypothetical protein VHV32_19190 [Candidatus Angelobacter sp.]|jgi:hypothetical protein|nr:hypothetical protein [Candidatus Angelobacter sp.]